MPSRSTWFLGQPREIHAIFIGDNTLFPSWGVFFFYSLDGFFHDRIRKTAPLQGRHDQIPPPGRKLRAVAALHQRHGSRKLRVLTLFIRGVDRLQRCCYLLGAQAFLAQVPGRGPAALAGGQQAVGPGLRVAFVVDILPLDHLGHHLGGGLLGKAAAEPLIQLAGGDFLRGQRFQCPGAGLGYIGGFFLLRQRTALLIAKRHQSSTMISSSLSLLRVGALTTGSLAGAASPAFSAGAAAGAGLLTGRRVA